MQTLDVNPSNTNICFLSAVSTFLPLILCYVHGCRGSVSASLTDPGFLPPCPLSLLLWSACAPQPWAASVAGSRHSCCPPILHLPLLTSLQGNSDALPICLSVGQVPNPPPSECGPRLLCYNYINCDASDSLFYGQSPRHCRTLLDGDADELQLWRAEDERRSWLKRETLLFEYITFLDLF